MRKGKSWANFQRVYNFLPKKLSPSSQKYGFGIRKKPIQDPGVKKAPDPGSGTLHGQNLSSTSGEPEIVAQQFQFQPQVAGRWGVGTHS